MLPVKVTIHRQLPVRSKNLRSVASKQSQFSQLQVSFNNLRSLASIQYQFDVRRQ